MKYNKNFAYLLHIQKKVFRYRKAFIFALIAVGFWSVAYAVFRSNTVTVPGDLPYYLEQATSLATGHGFTNAAGESAIARGPIFPLMLALGFLLSGHDLWTVYNVIWAMAAVTAAGLALVAWQWWGITAAVISFTLYLLNPLVLAWSGNHLDAVWPVFLVASIWLSLHRPTERRGLGIGIALGLTVGFGFLTKEVMILLAPLPFLAMLTASRLDYSLKRMLISYLIVLAILVGGWAAYVVFNGATLNTAIFGSVAPGAGHSFLDGSLNLSGFSGVLDYLRQSGVPLLPLEFTLIGGVFLAYRGGREERVVLFALALLAPFIAYVLIIKLRPGQLIPLVALISLLAGRVIVAVAEFVTRWRRGWPSVVTALVLTVIVVVPVNESSLRRIRTSLALTSLNSQAPEKILMLFSAGELLELLHETKLDTTETLLIYDTELNCYTCSIVYFNFHGTKKALPIPFDIESADGLQFASWLPQAKLPGLPDYVRPQFNVNHPRHRLWFLDFQLLLSYAKERGAYHLAIIEAGNEALLQFLETRLETVAVGHGYRLFALREEATNPREPIVIENKQTYCTELATLSEDAQRNYFHRLSVPEAQAEALRASCKG